MCGENVLHRGEFMAQHDYSIDNTQNIHDGTLDINNALSAIVSNNSGATAPSTTYAYMLWADTTTNILKQRNANNDAWINIRNLDGTFDALSATTFTGTGDFTSADIDTLTSDTHTTGALTVENNTHGADTLITLNAENDAGTEKSATITYDPDDDVLINNKPMGTPYVMHKEWAHFYVFNYPSFTSTKTILRSELTLSTDPGDTNLGAGTGSNIIDSVNASGLYVINIRFDNPTTYNHAVKVYLRPATGLALQSQLFTTDTSDDDSIIFYQPYTKGDAIRISLQEYDDGGIGFQSIHIYIAKI